MYNPTLAGLPPICLPHTSCIVPIMTYRIVVVPTIELLASAERMGYDIVILIARLGISMVIE